MAASSSAAPNVIQVSAANRALNYVFRAEKVLQDYEDIELSGLGSAINLVVSSAEMIKKKNYAVITQIETSMLEGGDGFPKPKILIKMHRSADFLSILADREKEKAAAAEERAKAAEERAAEEAKEE